MYMNNYKIMISGRTHHLECPPTARVPMALHVGVMGDEFSLNPLFVSCCVDEGYIPTLTEIPEVDSVRAGF